MARRTKEDACATRNSLLDAAEQVFYEQGVARASLNEIAQRAGATRGAVYWHFKDKADLLGALYARSVLPKELILSIAAETGSDPLCSLMDAGVASLREFEEDEGKQRMFRIMSDMTIGDDARTNLARVDAELDALILRVMTCAKDTGGLHPEICAREAAVFVGVTIGGLLAEWLRSGKSFPLASYGEKLLRRHIAMLRGDAVGCGLAPAPGPAPETAAAPAAITD